jgi:Tfp pilus assembly protein PilO
MRGAILPLILLIIAGIVFFVGVNYVINGPIEEKVISRNGQDVITINGGINSLNTKKAELVEALNKASELRQKLDALEKNYQGFDQADLDRLNKLLPDNVDNVQLIIDTNNIAQLHNMKIKGARIATAVEKEATGGRPADVKTKTRAIERSAVPEQGVLTFSFSVTGPYKEFLLFLSDLQSSLRVVDLGSLTFSSDEKEAYTYNVEIKTYWLK